MEIANCLDIYKLLETTNFKFTKEDMNKKWNIFAGPKEIMKIVKERKGGIEKEKVKFLEEMKVNRDDFKSTVDNLEKTIGNFDHYQAKSDHKIIAQEVKFVNESLLKQMDDSRKYNNQETLFGLESSNFDQIGKMQREFINYSNLWLTTDTWLSNKDFWMECPWEQLNAEEVNKFVEEGTGKLQSVIRFFEGRSQKQVLQIAKEIKAEIDAFKEKVPLMLALRKKGMKERHWQQISDQLKMTVDPKKEGFNFKKVSFSLRKPS